MKSLFLWGPRGQRLVNMAEDLPITVNAGQEEFQLTEIDLPDVDYIRDSANLLIGFVFLMTIKESEEIFPESFIDQRDDFQTFIMVAPTDTWSIDVVQAMGTRVYKSCSGNVMLALPDWGFEKLAFAIR